MRPAVKLLLLAVLGVGVAIPTAYTTFIHSERSVTIGAHEARVQPNFTGFVRIQSGPILPDIRIPTDVPGNLGVTIRLGEADVSDLEQLVARDAVIASHPEGEIESLRATVLSMVIDATLRAVGSALLAMLIAVLAWRAIGRERRRVLLAAARRPHPRQVAGAAGVAAVTLAAVVLVAAPERPRSEDQAWAPIRTVFPEIPAGAVLDDVEIAEGASTSGGRAIVEGALKTYQTSVEFYGRLALVAATADVRTPEEDETTALVVTDRHDNIGMDPVARAVASAAQATILIDLGDDTSNGASWEEFSINSLAREFRDFEVVAVAGNHDTGDTVAAQMRDKGFTVLSGEPVTVGGIRFLGSSDPRSSGLTAGYHGDPSENSQALRDQDAALTKAACEAGDVSVIAVHSPSSAKTAAASGCVDLVLSGHLHRQVGPTTTTGVNGRQTTTLSTASTGGAVYAFALGSKLRREAQVTIVTFKNGRPVGLQPVTFEPGGIVTVEEYSPVTTSVRPTDTDESP